MSEPDKKSISQIIVDFVQSAGRPVSLEKIARHYASAKPERRTDTGNRYDKLFRQADGRFVPYEPAVHGVWEIYSDDSGTKRVRLALEPTAEAEHGDTPAATGASTESPLTEFRFESHLRDYLAQNLQLFDFLGTRLRLDPAFLVPIDDLVAGHSGDPELAAQGGNRFAIEVASDEAKLLVHLATLLPGHSEFPPMPKNCKECVRYGLLAISQDVQSASATRQGPGAFLQNHFFLYNFVHGNLG